MVNTIMSELYKEEDFLGTIARAKELGVTYIWSGDLSRSRYLHNCLGYAEKNNLVELTPVQDEQSSGYLVEWK